MAALWEAQKDRPLWNFRSLGVPQTCTAHASGVGPRNLHTHEGPP